MNLIKFFYPKKLKFIFGLIFSNALKNFYGEKYYKFENKLIMKSYFKVKNGMKMNIDRNIPLKIN